MEFKKKMKQKKVQVRRADKTKNEVKEQGKT